MNSVYDYEGKRILPGDRIVMMNDGSVDSDMKEFIFKHKVFGVVCSDAIQNDYYCAGGTFMADFRAYKPFAVGDGGLMTVRGYRLKRLEQNEYAEYEKLADDAYSLVLAKEHEIKEVFNLPEATVGYKDRTFNFSDRDLLLTNYNSVACGSWDGDSIFEAYGRNYRYECCDFTQDYGTDYKVYIPDIYMRYFGWTVGDLKSWVEFLNNCEMGFRGKYLGTDDLSDFNYAEKRVDGSGLPGYIKACPLPGRSSMYPYKDGLFHTVAIKGSHHHKWQSYMRFICLRYFYNSQYWTIPGHAMQIKDALGDKVTHWQALLMAHLYRAYNPYYSFGEQIDYDASKPYLISEYYTDHDDLDAGFWECSNFDRHLDPFMPLEDLLERINANDRGFNRSFDYVCDAYSRQDLERFFAEKDYLGLLDYLKAKQAVPGIKQWRLNTYRK